MAPRLRAHLGPWVLVKGLEAEVAADPVHHLQQIERVKAGLRGRGGAEGVMGVAGGPSLATHCMNGCLPPSLVG